MLKYIYLRPYTWIVDENEYVSMMIKGWGIGKIAYFSYFSIVLWIE